MTVERFPVEAGHVLMFRRAVGYPDAEAGADTAGIEFAPPTFVQASAQFEPEYRLRPSRAPWWGSAREAGTMFAGGGGLHAEQHYTYHRPVRVGDVLSSTVRPGKVWEKTGRSGVLRFAETFTEYRDEQGELVVTARSVSVLKNPREEQ
ncbi:MaoC family dehydratase N-terminal domain-containing protein [Nocardia sp. NBC_00881]|uniref:FAS1-like dehydratase domain-containing protein n=1 Tax=Nocardia sp. NBC_00881 TaxID=2975995 RepID=UPI00386308E7|nr:MaoC family dehydratase N-terminal domain-containing protein [Nocardia sp. NBC_00881]